MDSIGLFFKSLRENQKITIDDLAEKTKIRPNIIKDIEADNLVELYESGHLKIFIQTLGKLLDASPADISEALNLVDKTFRKPSQQNVHVIEHKSQSKFVISSNTIYSIFLVLFLIGIAFVIIYFYNEGKLTYERVKNDLFADKATVAHEDNEEDVDTIEKDSVWIKQQRVLNSKQSTSDKRKTVIDNVKVIYDSTDYVSDILFDNQYNALNPQL